MTRQILSQYGNNCYLTSYLHLLSLVPGEWVTNRTDMNEIRNSFLDYNTQHIDIDKYKIFDAGRYQDQITIIKDILSGLQKMEVRDNLAINFYEEFKPDSYMHYISYTAKYLEFLGISNPNVYIGDPDKFEQKGKRYLITDAIPVNPNKPEGYETAKSEFNPFNVNQIIGLFNCDCDLRIVAFTISTGSHHYIISRMMVGNEIKLCVIDPIYKSGIRVLTENEKTNLLERIQTINNDYNVVEYILYRRVGN